MQWDGTQFNRVLALPFDLGHHTLMCNIWAPRSLEDLFKGVEGVSLADLLAQLNPTENTFTVFPNPAKDEASIRYQITEASSVNIDVVDVTGRVVEKVINQEQSAGTYQQRLNIENGNYNRGIFFIRSEINGELKMTKIILE